MVDAELDVLRAELREARRALQGVQAKPDALRAEIIALEQIISERLGPLPLPSEELRLHVGAKVTASNFLNQGWSSSRKVISLFGENPEGPVLDWGCGTGRTLRWLLAHPGWQRSYRGVDVDRAAIEWLNRNGISNVLACDDKSVSLPLGDSSVDGIFSFSVLTHIHPRLFREWFNELARVIRPGVLAYLTFNGDSIVESPDPNHKKWAAEFKEKGSTWIEQAGHYKSAAFASHDFVAEAAAGAFKVEKIVRRDYGPMDALYARKLSGPIGEATAGI